MRLTSGDSHAYWLEWDGKAAVYSTDSEHKLDDPASARAFADFFRDADLVIFDAMYSLADAFSIKEDWGHSSNVVGVGLCQMAGVRHLMLLAVQWLGRSDAGEPADAGLSAP